MGTTETIHADLLVWLRAHQWEVQNGYMPKFHAVMGDPPYFLGSIVRRYGKPGSKNGKSTGVSDMFTRTARGFMGKSWDGFDSLEDYQEWVRTWAELMLSYVHPGAVLAMSGGTRTYHRLANGLEDAGWEIFDSMLAWNYAQGFPKALDFGKAMQKQFCSCTIVGSAEPEAHEDSNARRSPKPKHDLRSMRDFDVPQALSDRNPKRKILQQGVPKQSLPGEELAAADDVRGRQPRMERGRYALQETRQLHGRSLRSRSRMGKANGSQGWLHYGASTRDGGLSWAVINPRRSRSPYRPQSSEQRSAQPPALPNQRDPQIGRARGVCNRCGKPFAPRGVKRWEGYKTALKPAYEPIVLARAPRGKETYAGLALKYGTGALNVDGGRIGSEHLESTIAGQARLGTFERGVMITPERDGRYPANLALVCSCEGWEHEPGCPVRVMDEQSGDRKAGGNLTGQEPSPKTAGIYGGGFDRDHQWAGYADEGGASRFFYTAKSPSWEREAGLSEWFYGSEHIIIDAVYWDERSQLWVNAESQVMLQMDTDQSPPKVIAVYGIEDKNVTAWNTLLFGSKPMERCLPAMTCITEMRISSITNSPTLSYLANSITSDSILDVSSSMGNGSNHAESAGSLSPWISITSESMEYPHGAPRAALRMQLRISVNEKPTPGKVNDGRAVDADNAYQRGATPRLATHPTMKPIKLMEWLAALLLPPPLDEPRRILVPFAGVASEMIGAYLAGWDEVVGIERESEYIPINTARRQFWQGFSSYDEVKQFLGIPDVLPPEKQGQMSIFDYLGGDE